jgi:hypothetical protein
MIYPQTQLMLCIRNTLNEDCRWPPMWLPETSMMSTLIIILFSSIQFIFTHVLIQESKDQLQTARVKERNKTKNKAIYKVSIIIIKSHIEHCYHIKLMGAKLILTTNKNPCLTHQVSPKLKPSHIVTCWSKSRIANPGKISTPRQRHGKQVSTITNSHATDVFCAIRAEALQYN